MEIIVFKDYEEMSNKASEMIKNQIKFKKNSVLGLPTGSTPIGMYKNLVKMYKKGEIDFTDIKTFNLDEYCNIPRENDQSYYYFMHYNLFNHINIKIENIHIPNGNAKNLNLECINYDKSIEAEGGIDIQVLGIGKNSHIGFNEPSNKFEKGTNIVQLKESTIKANSRFFKSEEDVPKKAITMGIGSIFKAKKIILLASGKEKAQAIYNTVYGDITPQIPSSILQLHQDVILILDEGSASNLKHKNILK